MKRLENECSNRQRSLSININNEKDKSNQSSQNSKKKHLRKQQTNEFNSSNNDTSPSKHRKQIINDDIKTKDSSSRWLSNQILIPFCIITYLLFKKYFS